MHRFYSLAYLSATAYRLLTTLILIIATVSISSCATKGMPIPQPKTHRSVNARLLRDELTKPIANAIIGIEQSKIGHGQTQELLFDNHEFSELLTPKVQRIEEKMNASLPDLPKQPHWQIRSILKANQVSLLC